MVLTYSGDIMADWKNARFVIADGNWAEFNCKHMIVLSDLAFWAEHAGQLRDWCEQHSCQHEGMTVSVPDDVTLTLFNLRWA